MATDKSVRQRLTTRSVCFNREAPGLWERIDKLAQATNISVSRIIAVSVKACIDTLESELPTKRSVKLNGKTLIP